MRVPATGAFFINQPMFVTPPYILFTHLLTLEYDPEPVIGVV